MRKGLKFKMWCIANGYTAKKVAELTGLKQSTIYQYFQGTRSPSKAAMKVLKEEIGADYELFM